MQSHYNIKTNYIVFEKHYSSWKIKTPLKWRCGSITIVQRQKFRYDGNVEAQGIVGRLKKKIKSLHNCMIKDRRQKIYTTQ